MAGLDLDPHPLGCPVGVACIPSQMPELLVAICVKLHDLLHPTVHQINPSRGQSYPILNLYALPEEAVPRLVIFPGWEDNRGGARRRLGYSRQVMLLDRIHQAAVRGEDIEEQPDTPISQDNEPFLMGVASTAAQFDDLVYDLYVSVGDVLHLTVASLRQEGAPDLRVIRAYAPSDHSLRLVLFPSWAGETESREAQIGAEQQLALLRELKLQKIPELSVHDFLKTALG